MTLIIEYVYVDKIVEVCEKVIQEKIREVPKIEYQDRVIEVQHLFLDSVISSSSLSDSQNHYTGKNCRGWYCHDSSNITFFFHRFLLATAFSLYISDSALHYLQVPEIEYHEYLVEKVIEVFPATCSLRHIAILPSV